MYFKTEDYRSNLEKLLNVNSDRRIFNARTATLTIYPSEEYEIRAQRNDWEHMNDYVLGLDDNCDDDITIDKGGNI